MSYMNILWKIEELMHFKWKSKFDHYDPKWPQVNIWPHNRGRGSQTDEHVLSPMIMLCNMDEL